MTPSLRGRMATMLLGVRPSIRLAAEPTATTLSIFVSIATTEGSERTIPYPLTNTSVFAVPRSIATSLPKSPPNTPIPIRSNTVRVCGPSACAFQTSSGITRLEHPVFLHTKVLMAQYHVIENLDPDYFGRVTQPARDLAVLAAWLRLSAWMVVRQDHACSTRPNRRFEYLTGMNQ